MKDSLIGFALRYGVEVVYLESTTSTNDVARGEGYSHGDVIIAEEQTAGRGQRGNRWESFTAENLTMSIVLEPRFLAVEKQFYLSQAVSLALADMLEGYGQEVHIKWPNDIYIGSRKTAGILIENDICGSRLARSIVGVGLNVNQKSFDPCLPNPTSMGLAADRWFDRFEVLERFYNSLISRYSDLEAGNLEAISADYERRLYKLGVEHTYKLPDGNSFRGTIRAVLPSGELVVEHSDLTVRAYLFKEIEYGLED